MITRQAYHLEKILQVLHLAEKILPIEVIIILNSELSILNYG